MEWVRGEAIGHGSFGAVNLAIPKSGGGGGAASTLMAVKSCGVSKSASLKNEREVLGQLGDCPQIIRCFGDGTSWERGEELYNVLIEYACGGSLADRIKKCGGGLPESDVRRYTRSILEGLEYIHGKGFVHCDIKLQNLLLCSSPHGASNYVKIADFGLAKKAKIGEKNEEDNRGFEFRGTPLYMSPESLTVGECESPADIWALGCAVAEMVSGKPAWRCSDNSDVTGLLFRIGVGEESPEVPETLPKDGQDFLKRCFVKDPKRRWTAEMLLNHPFVLDDGSSTVPLEITEAPSTSPRSPFDFPELVSVRSSYCTTFAISPSPKSEAWFDRELSSFFDSSYERPPGPSPADRLRQLAGEEQQPSWSMSDSWVTVR